jgi:prepilin-type N-terminal cleavage/methylation domain-containing protein
MQREKANGFTLIEIAIVLVIVGLLLGGVLKGQELINSAKVKNLAGDFRTAPALIYAYQDKFRRLPGDDVAAATRWKLAAGHAGNGNGTINGAWNAQTPGAGNESVLLWEHLRRAGLASGSEDFSSADATRAALPVNAEGGAFGISGEKPISSLGGGAFYACSDAIDGKFAAQIDLALDDERPDAGALQAVEQSGGASQADGAHGGAAQYVEGTRYTLCMRY